MNRNHFTVAGVLVWLLAGLMSVSAQEPGDNYPPVKDRSEIQVTSLTVNSSEDDFAPSVLRGGELLLFTSARSGPFGSAGMQRIWASTKTAGGWSTPITTSEALSHAEQVGSATLTPDGNFMIFAAYDWDNAEQDLIGNGRTDLYSAERVRGEWTNIKNLGPAVNSPDWDSQPSLSPDGRLLYFASDRAGGEGETDIYVSRLTASGWASPVPVSETVNTALDDMTPAIAPDGKSLFFASNGMGGVGGFDLFVAKGGNELGTAWNSIENLGMPINSGGNEYYYVSLPNSKNAFFSSDRGAGDQNIYLAYPNPFPPEALVTVSGQVVDAVTKQPIAADITVTDLSSGEVVATYRTDDRTGDYYVVLTRGRRYSITAEAPNYVFYSDEYVVRPDAEGKDLERNILLFPTSVGQTRLLVFFDYDKAELQNESMPDLKRAVQFLKSNPDISVEVAGHTDSVSTEAYNQKLSQDRANSVMRYLISGGIDKARVTAKGYGESQPVADNGTEEGRAANRRVEMRIMKAAGGAQPRR